MPRQRNVAQKKEQIKTPEKALTGVPQWIKCFLDKVKLKELTITKPLLYEMLKGLIGENLERKEQWSLPLRTYFFPRSRSCVDAGRLFTQGQVLPAFLPARSETVGCISPFSRTCLRHLIFHGSGTPRQKKMAQMKEQIKAPEKIYLRDEEIANLSDA